MAAALEKMNGRRLFCILYSQLRLSAALSLGSKILSGSHAARLKGPGSAKGQKGTDQSDCKQITGVFE